ncbi:MAG TPA: RuBisCO large subunit C-terminal-like domain-containing protein [Nitrospira sp.]|nr:RuBisCO large subunit C-terminal-like domain-containing protein [Nitrospira sp.]
MPTDLSGSRFSVTYRLHGAGGQTRITAERLCADQTIEAPAALLASCPIPADLLGRLEDYSDHGHDTATARISFSMDLFGRSIPQLLHTLFGTASLTPGIRVMDLHLPSRLPEGWPGPRYGVAGIRRLLAIARRPLVCAVLKPLGLSPQALAALASEFARAGVDLIKEDQGLGDHSFCPFEERVSRCLEAVRSATRSTGRRCLYVPHVAGSPHEVSAQIRFAGQAGVDGFLLSPGLIGYATVHEWTNRAERAGPILAHPAFLGTYAAHPDSGLSPRVLYGQLPRLIGADISIFPACGSGFPVSRADCRDIASACREPWSTLEPIFPTAAGRMSEGRIAEMLDLYGRDVVFVLGSRVRLDPAGVTAACERFLTTLEHLAR